MCQLVHDIINENDVVIAISQSGETADTLAAIKLAKEKGFALPAVNVIGSNTINGVLETAKALNAPVIIQFS